ncbi:MULTISPECIES: DUF1830 domain-containing protein [unclassified Limnospira]|uniref:DUF1830 domain-containing protein n=1 Tax=unclassified Limnospira TaxID=2642885 RepID=UPI0028E0F4E7|nr:MULTISPECIES: DUF1830 domain-containing protein [unclassified Limnospira]MDT9194300.1 DUF1830 domain-containing protein [Limnospira sp. PMC 1245.20]MDT9209719.1 DUF1830 domain-containing protein [Limnospira sp. PMC 1252.20]MDT9260735.1 DUF1830 domain-containing protein [Limnospira sp. PMC 1236.20]MDT9281247.1 DUF1830 domain-containing protein [Limnospira sp. PMC 1293.21]MDT9291427.1 DUF1830 domain-containing protein [Limnospira sp. PMC 1295.21]
MMSNLYQLNNHQTSKQLCCYYNDSPKVEIARISNIDNWYLEHIVFPGERFLFESPSDAELEIYHAGKGKPILMQKLLCLHLIVDEGEDLKCAS